MHTALFHWLPVVLLILALGVIYVRTGNRTDPYRLPQPWTHAPILWSAVDESVPGGTGGESVPSVGGGASGRW